MKENRADTLETRGNFKIKHENKSIPSLLIIPLYESKHVLVLSWMEIKVHRYICRSHALGHAKKVDLQVYMDMWVMLTPSQSFVRLDLNKKK